MKGDWWLWIAFITFLVFCCLPMLFMGRRRRRSHDATKEGTDRPSGDRREPQ